MGFCPKCGAKVEANAAFCGDCGAQLQNTSGVKDNPVAKAEEFISKLPSVKLVHLVEDIGLHQLADGKLECCCGSNTFHGTACLFAEINSNGKQAYTTTLLHDLTCSKCGRHLLYSNSIAEDEAGKIMFVKEEELEKLDEAQETLNEEGEEAEYDISRCFVLDLDRKLLHSAEELGIFPFALLNETLNTSGLLLHTILSFTDVLFNVNESKIIGADFDGNKVDSSSAYSAFALKCYGQMGDEKKKFHLSLKPNALPMTLDENNVKPVHLDWDYCYAIDNEGDMEEVTPDSHYDDWKKESQEEIDALKKFFAEHPKLKVSGAYRKEDSGEDKIRKILSWMRGDSIFKAGHLNKKKVLNAMASYANNVKIEDIILHVDDTVFGGAKEGCIITRNAVYFKEILAEPGKLRIWKSSKFSLRKDAILEDGVERFTLSSVNGEGKKLIVDLLNALAANVDNA